MLNALINGFATRLGEINAATAEQQQIDAARSCMDMAAFDAWLAARRAAAVQPLGHASTSRRCLSWQS